MPINTFQLAKSGGRVLPPRAMNFWVRALVTVFAAIFFAVASYISIDYFGQDSELQAYNLFFSVLFGFCSAMLMDIMALRRAHFENVELILAKLEREAKAHSRQMGDLRAMTAHSVLTQRLSSQTDLIRDIGFEALRCAVTGIAVPDAGSQPQAQLSIVGEDLVVSTYRCVWSLLNERQKFIALKAHETTPRDGEAGAGSNRGLVAYVTHSNSIDIWRGHHSTEMTSLQASFAISGGEVNRIFMCRKQDDEKGYQRALTKYGSVVKRMRSADLGAYFLEFDPKEDDAIWREAGLHDFLVVPELHLIVEWNSDPSRELLNDCIISEDRDRAEMLVDRWFYFAAMQRKQVLDDLQRFEFPELALQIPDKLMKRQRQLAVGV